MIVMPSIDLLSDRVVSLVGGKPGTQQVELPGPLDVFARWVREGAEWVHVVDLDAAFNQGSHKEAIRAMIQSRQARVQLGGGIRSEEQLRGWIQADADRVVVGTQGIRDPEWLRRMAGAFPDRIVQAIDADRGRIVTDAWTTTTSLDFVKFARSLKGLPLAGLLYTAVHVEGRQAGIDRDGVGRLLNAVDLPVTVSGGITTLDDLQYLKEAGAAAAVLGLALYNGTLDFAQAKNLVEGV